jgi:hypothetical protein
VGSPGSLDTATATAIGWGYFNTSAIVLQGNTDTATSAARLADAHTATVSGALYDDWYLPSKDELNQMCKWARGHDWLDSDDIDPAWSCNHWDTGILNSAIYGASDAGFEEGVYWSSSESGVDSVGNSDYAWWQDFRDGRQYDDYKYIGEVPYPIYVRPIRSF